MDSYQCIAELRSTTEGCSPMWYDSEDRDSGKAPDYCLCEADDE